MAHTDMARLKLKLLTYGTVMVLSPNMHTCSVGARVLSLCSLRSYWYHVTEMNIAFTYLTQNVSTAPAHAVVHMQGQKRNIDCEDDIDYSRSL